MDDGAGLIGSVVSSLDSFNRQPILLGRLPPDIPFLSDVQKILEQDVIL